MALDQSRDRRFDVGNTFTVRGTQVGNFVRKKIEKRCRVITDRVIEDRRYMLQANLPKLILCLFSLSVIGFLFGFS